MLAIYYDLPLFSDYAIDQVDTFTGTGTDATFDVVNKDYTRVGAVIEYDNTNINKYDGGFTPNSDDTVTLATNPPMGAEGVIPGINTLSIGVLYDQDTVPGLLNPRVMETPFWLADPDNIDVYIYRENTGIQGIEISVVNLITAGTAAVSWCQLASSQADSYGSAWTYLVSGESLYTEPLSTMGLINASSIALVTSLFVDSASDFQLGDYIKIGSGYVNQEVVRILSFTSPYELGTTGMTWDHNIGETVYTCGRKFWLKTTVPTNAVSNTATTLYNLAMELNYTTESRY